jgi:hypothetical protein
MHPKFKLPLRSYGMTRSEKVIYLMGKVFVLCATFEPLIK